jgi:hypothetical protein
MTTQAQEHFAGKKKKKKKPVIPLHRRDQLKLRTLNPMIIGSYKPQPQTHPDSILKMYQRREKM